MIVGAIDIGSNSVRLLVRDHHGSDLHRDTVVTGLARGVDAGGPLSVDSVAATLRAIRRYRAILDDLGAERSHAVATSAARDAPNGAEVMEAVGSVLGSAPEIISGEREASLSFAGATAGLDAGGSRVVVDIGGGSTEVIQGDGRIRWAYSYDIGSVRLTDRVLGSRPAPDAELRAAMDEVDRILGMPEVVARAGSIIGVAGTFTSLAAIHRQLDRYDPDLVHGTVLTRSDLEELLGRLAALDVAATAAIPSLEPGRAPVILAGTVVAERVMATVGAEEVVVSEADLLDAVADELLAG